MARTYNPVTRQWELPAGTAAPAAAPRAGAATGAGAHVNRGPGGGGTPVDWLSVLNQNPGVVAAKYYEKQGLEDLASEPMPGAPSSAGYMTALQNLMEDKAVMIPRLDYSLGVNKAGLEHQAVIDKRNIINSLAARGMLRSGEKGYLQGEQQWGYSRALTDLTTKDQWAREDMERNIRHQQAAIGAARASANAAYASALAARQRGINISKRELHNRVIDAYVEGWKEIINNPADYLGLDPNFKFDPAALGL